MHVAIANDDRRIDMNLKDKIIVSILLIIMIIFAVPFTIKHTEAASSKIATLTQKTGYTIKQDELRKIMSKKLGTPYSKMDCSTYVAWVVKNLGKTKAKENAIKDVQIASSISTYMWKQAGKYKISYKPAVYNEKTKKWVWGNRKSIAINKNMTTWKSSSKKTYKKALANLQVGDALLYKNEEHIACYFGKFSSASKVAAYLKKYCGMKTLKKSKTAAGNTCYKYKGKVVLIQYAGCGNNWRIHSTSSYGVVIDNDITFHNGTFGGKWYGTVQVIETMAE